MDKRVINKFAVQARRDLIDGVTRRLNQLGITAQGVADKEERSTSTAEYYVGNTQPLEGRDIARRSALVQRLREMAAKSEWATAYRDLIEEVSYTWFNRIIAIRFMEVNDYLPSRTRVLSSLENLNEPDIMRDALDLEDDLGQYTAEERALIQKAQELQQPNDLDAMYRMLFLKQVNKLNESLPKLFEKTDDFMTLLFTPSYNRGVIANLVAEIPEADFDIASDDSQGQVEILGWLYQYYNQEQKDAAISSPKAHKFRGQEIASATQIFTPDWIVKYMVQNSAGKLWIEHLISLDNNLNETDLAQEFDWQFYMPDADQPAETKEKLADLDGVTLRTLKPEQLTILDPSMGSGHILVYAFDMLVPIYQREGYSKQEAAKLIVESNLFGLDIDKRAFQLAYFSVMMKFRKYNRRALNLEIRPRVSKVGKAAQLSKTEITTAFPELAETEVQTLVSLGAAFAHADLTGSLTNVSAIDIEAFKAIRNKVQDTQTILADQLRDQIDALISLTNMLRQKYEVVVTNPPYMGSSRMNSYLAEFAKEQYPESKSDLFAMFLQHFNQCVDRGGYVAMVTMQSWMFLSSFERLRIRLLNSRTISNLMHMENNVMGIAFGTAVTITRNAELNGFIGTYHQIKTGDVAGDKIPTSLPIEGNRFNRANQANFSDFPGKRIAYWASDSIHKAFLTGTPLEDLAFPRRGLQTGDAIRFVHKWWEVAKNNLQQARDDHKRWVLFNNGGPYRRWFGNVTEVVPWGDNGEEIKEFSGSIIPNENMYRKRSVVWNKITSGRLSARINEDGWIQGDAAPFALLKDDSKTNLIISFMNSSVYPALMDVLNETMNKQVGDLKLLPILFPSGERYAAVMLGVNKAIELTQNDWNSFEYSEGFKVNVLLGHGEKRASNSVLEMAYNQWAQEAADRFNQLKANEEALNRIFIDLYGLQDELTPEVADKDVSVRKADLPRDIKAFLSYFIGVVFGRYSLDVPGLAFAGGEWDASKYQTFKPNTDDLILLTDEDYFGDQRDIINRLKEFLTTTFGTEHLSENLRFIADALGKKGDNPEEQIRKYFLDDFYKKDHLSTYQKRPIYWQLSSGRQGGFRALMYLHRYDENTLAMVRTLYLHPLQEAYGNRRTQLKNMIEVEANAKQRNAMTKEVAKLDKQLDEITKYDISLQHVANMHIKLDLDDGVLVNHEKVQGGQKLLDPLK
ncbi:BREX-1 system adenine-specific DNA-methyltransferase PglX [Lacticaseibacillus salsurivasis]|uniref:BREX-1 system adenine-specific DNA-methyltransferase PglX n=1 Tax=Lacticaseibacillus salsurivasis TaxID=3081441 RepID=UPI0030C70944